MATVIIQADVQAPLSKTWAYYNEPTHVQVWNAAHESWHCPKAENELKDGGRFSYRMEARDGSFGFDYAGTYTKVQPEQLVEYQLDDERNVAVAFVDNGVETRVAITFETENQNPIEFQELGWQAILNNFKAYTEAN